MNYSIGAYDPDKRSVPVIFDHADVTHERSVNAVLDDDGAYDPEATAVRVAEVARGVQVKIELGVITNAPPPPEPPVTDPEA